MYNQIYNDFIGGSDNNIKDIGNQIVIDLLKLKNQIKIFHWQTKGYAEHKALDNLFNILNEKNDQWVETFMGKYGRIYLGSKKKNIILINLDNIEKENGVIVYIKEWLKHMISIRDQYFNDSSNSDLKIENAPARLGDVLVTLSNNNKFSLLFPEFKITEFKSAVDKTIMWYKEGLNDK